MDRELLENVIVTAIEGGSNNWCLIKGKTRNLIRKKVPRSVDPSFSTAMLSAILDHEIDVEVYDAENPTELLGVLSLKTMAERLKKLRDDASYCWALEAEENGNGDAESSDIIFQYLILGEVWFS